MAYRDEIDRLLAQYGEQVRTAFLSAIDDIANSVTLKVIVERLERGDVNGAIEAIGLDPQAFERLERAIADAYAGGGEAEVGNLPAIREPSGARVIFRFGTRNTEGERQLREHSSTLVTRIVADQREAIRGALSEGLAEGKNPRATALDVVGRIDRATNRRTGGIIGLTAAQERYVASARAELASGDPKRLQAFLERERRDKRFDRTINAAIKSGSALPAELVTRITGRYADSLLALRGEMLARTETMTALAKGRDDAIRQQIDSGKIANEDVTKRWRSAKDERVRLTHRILDGKSAPMDGFFVSPSGAMLKHPCDPSAPASEVVGCRCFMVYEVDRIGVAVRKMQAA
ncbi:hypothetical protein GCM10011390_41710 [Aureimonas endophytica]|uniref:Phage head morphogenesis domain-containing protein n=1 Tax=Aureimonas endophytica TaxID=2027858 RepID=A0A917EBA8_9HYPH|nr:phage minor head protein [Aureimonas endophytica]GGE18187.1 hypothetical protein GCM10011390_41710 [Aureimonas endophytica]